MGLKTKQWFWRLARVAITVAGPCVLAGVPLPTWGWPTSGRVQAIALAFVGSLALLAWVAFLAKGRRRDDRWARQNPVAWWVLLAVGSGFITASLVGQNIHATWRVIDDHDYVTLMGPAGGITVGQLYNAIVTSNEIFRPTVSSLRYRPTFWLLRYVEIYFWGQPPDAILGDENRHVRIVRLSGLVGAMGLAGRHGGGAGAGIDTLVTLLVRYLVPSGLLGGARHVGHSDGRRGHGRNHFGSASAGRFRHWRWRGWWTLLGAGAILAMGAKENLLILMPLVWVFMVWVGNRRGARGLGIAGWLSGLLVSLAGLWIGGVVVVATWHAGVDIYKNPTGMGPRFRALIGWMTAGDGRLWMLLACAGAAFIVMTYFTCMARRPGPGRRMRRRTVNSRALLFALFAITVLSQAFFYNGVFPTADHTRYDFPGLIAAVLAVAAVVDLAVGRGLVSRRSRGYLRVARAVVVMILGLVVMQRGFETIKLFGWINVKESQTFMNHIDRVVLRAYREPQRPVLVIAYEPADLEFATSVVQFLRAGGMTNRAFLLDAFRIVDQPDAQSRHLATIMDGISRDGGGGFNPMREYRAGLFPFGVLLDFNGNRNFSENVEVVLMLISGGPMAGAPGSPGPRPPG